MKEQYWNLLQYGIHCKKSKKGIGTIQKCFLKSKHFYKSNHAKITIINFSLLKILSSYKSVSKSNKINIWKNRDIYISETGKPRKEQMHLKCKLETWRLNKHCNLPMEKAYLSVTINFYYKNLILDLFIQEIKINDFTRFKLGTGKIIDEIQILRGKRVILSGPYCLI